MEHPGLPCTFRPDLRITLIGDSFAKAIQGMTPDIIVQCFGKVTVAELRQLLKQGKIQLNYHIIILMVGGLQVLTTPLGEIVDGIEQLILSVRNKNTGAVMLVSTLLYRPKDETLLKERLDVINDLLDQMVTKLAKVGCKVFLIRSHRVLLSTSDDKLLRPIHVYFQDGFFPSKLSGSLLARFMLRCAKLVYDSMWSGLVRNVTG